MSYDKAPGLLGVSLEQYIERRLPPCHFLLCFMANNLLMAVQAADDDNILRFKEIAAWLEKYAPVECYGSPEKVSKWLRGRHKPRTEKADVSSA